MLKFTDFILQEVRTRVKYAPLPPKAIKKPPIERSNVSRVLEVLRQRISAFKNHRRAFQRNPNKKHNNRILGLYAGDINQDLNVISESYDSFNIEKPAGYGTFLTAADLGIKIKAGFAHHPSVEEELHKRMHCQCDDCQNERKKLKHKIKRSNND